MNFIGFFLKVYFSTCIICACRVFKTMYFLHHLHFQNAFFFFTPDAFPKIELSYIKVEV